MEESKKSHAFEQGVEEIVNLNTFDLYDQLLSASIDGDLETVQTLTAQKIDSNILNAGMLAACFYGHLEAVKFYTDIGVNPNVCFQTACKKKHYEIVEYLLQKIADVKVNCDEPIMLDIKESYSEKVKTFIGDAKELAEQKNISTSSLLWRASKDGQTKVVSDLLKKVDYVQTHRDEAIQIASENGHSEVVNILLKNGANVHANREYALTYASENGHAAVVSILLEKGADLRVGNYHALRWASRNGHSEVVDILLKNGADVHTQNNESLRSASCNGNSKVVDILLKNGAEVHDQNDEALRLAINNGHLEVVNLLIQNNAYLQNLDVDDLRRLWKNFRHYRDYFLFAFGHLMKER